MSLDRPKLRPLEALPLRQGGKDYVVLRDPTGLVAQPVAVDLETFFIIRQFDGQHSVLDIQAAYVRQFGSLVFSDRIRELVRQLNDQHLLATEEFRIFYEAVREEFDGSPVRAPVSAGTAYPAEPVALTAMLHGILQECPPVKLEERPGPLAALIAPHIDYERGRKAYAAAFREVETLTGPQLVLVMGTAHQPGTNLFALSRKHFATPLGQVQTDVEFVDALAERLPFDPFADEFTHRGEHSVELEAVFLKYLFRESAGLRVVPVLCGGFGKFIEPGGPALAGDEQMEAMVSAIREVSRSLHRPTLLLAAADLSHVGPQFGDADPVGLAKLQATEATDMNFLMRAGRADPEGLLRTVTEHGDRTHICGLPPVYLLLRVLEPVRGRLLRYEQWKDGGGQAAVTFAAVGFYGKG